MTDIYTALRAATLAQWEAEADLDCAKQRLQEARERVIRLEAEAVESLERHTA